MYKSTAPNKQTHKWMSENAIYLYGCLPASASLTNSFYFFYFVDFFFSIVRIEYPLCPRALFKRATLNEYFAAGCAAELYFIGRF